MSSLQDPLIAVPVSYLITGLLAAGARFVISKEAPTLGKIVETLVVSGAVIFSIYPYLQEKEYGAGVMNLIIASCSFGARDILGGLVRLGVQFKNDPMAFLREYLNRTKP